jgi:deoxycytidine triphosphate deaminase
MNLAGAPCCRLHDDASRGEVMSIKSDNWIRRMAREHAMIDPFEPGQVRETNGHKIVSYGTSSYGYDVRCASEFKIFTNINSTIVDPKKFDEKSFVDFPGDVCIIPPNSFALARTVEYLRIPRDVLVLAVGKSTYARCFRGDTRVALVDGTFAALEEMARGHDAGELYRGYSIGPGGRLIVTLLDAPRFIGRDALLEITLDSGELIQATPDHFFMRRDGRMAEAHTLRPGDALMPLYRDLVRGYEAVYQPIEGYMYPTHRLADEWNLRHDIYEDIPGTHRHHMDFDRRNHRPTNIERMEASEHIRLHNADSYGDGFDPGAHGAAIRASLERRAQDPRWREDYARAQANRSRDFWSDERYAEIRQRLIEARRNPTDATRAAHRRAMLRRFSDPAERQRHARRSEITFARVQPALHVTGSIRGLARYRNHKVAAIRELPGHHDVFCLTVPEAGNFALEAGVFVRNCGIIVNVTPLEPEWEGHVTLEFSNTTPLPAKIYANEGVAQMLFFESDEVCSVSYRDRGGKYQGQRGVTLPKT